MEEKNYFAESKIDEDRTLLIGCKGEKSIERNYWHLDFGANTHICGEKHLFVKFAKLNGGNITLGDSLRVQIKGKGIILFH